MNIRCVTYKDQFSAGQNAYNDLMIGYEKRVVGCGSKVFGSSRKDDIVIINAKKDGIIHALIVRLDQPLESCDAWSAEGGLDWTYNWTYEPITTIFQYDETFKREMIDFCALHSLTHTNLFHSRFCSNKLKKAVDHMIERFSISSQNIQM
jgi:hypothetical protein